MSHTRLDPYTVRPGRGRTIAATAREEVVVVPLSGLDDARANSLATGFEIAKKLVDAGAAVRLVGEGVTLPNASPDWVRDAPDLVLTELGAYFADDWGDAQRELRESIESWLNDLFGTLWRDEVPVADVLCGSSAVRLFARVHDAVPYVRALSECHPLARFHSSNPHWAGLALLRSAGHAVADSQGDAGRLAWTASLASRTAIALARTFASGGRRFVRSAGVRRWTRAARRARSAPSIWAAIEPAYGLRANRHVIDAVVRPCIRSQRSVGLLLTSSLDPAPTGTKGSTGPDRWPDLADVLEEVGKTVTIEQVAEPISAVALAAAMLRTARGALHGVVTLARRGPNVSHGVLQLDLSPLVSDAARFLTSDLLNAFVARAATLDVLSRVPAPEAVVFSLLGAADTAAPAAWLRRAGAVTIDFIHGAGGEGRPCKSEPKGSVAAVWTSGDAEILAALGARPVVVGVPRHAKPSAPRATPPRRILVVSNYLHSGWDHAGLPLIHQHEELLAAVDLIRGSLPDRFDVRWRPHPSDNRRAVSRVLKHRPYLSESTNHELADDLDWSDVVISTNSSSIYEALAWRRPIFIHVRPSQRMLPETRAFGAGRCFYYARDLVDPFAACIRAMDAGDESYLAPEERAKRLLIGDIDSSAALETLLDAVRGASSAG